VCVCVCVCVSHLFILSSVVGLILQLGYCELCCSKHVCSGFSLIYWVYAQEWYSRLISRHIFSFLKNFHADFRSGCISCLHSHQQCTKAPFPKCPCQYLLFAFLMIAMLGRVRWNLRVVLIFISFMVKDVEHCLIHLLAICTCSFHNYLLICPFTDWAICSFEVLKDWWKLFWDDYTYLCYHIGRKQVFIFRKNEGWI
jgi:hypothetical protein